MGYCVSVGGVVKIKKTNADKTIKLLGELMDSVNERGGGSSFIGGEIRYRYFSWVSTNTVKDCLKNNDLVGALREWRYIFNESDSGDLCFEYFDGEKLGDDEVLWEALAPAIDKGGELEYRGEDDARWRYLFDGTGMTEQVGQTIWI